ncbi:hypothetical protein JCM13369A_29480 [Mediterraneibacter glycyrrhizinilyticus JCM 13369]
MFTSCGTALYAEPRTFCRTVRRVTLAGEVKHFKVRSRRETKSEEGEMSQSE